MIRRANFILAAAATLGLLGFAQPAAALEVLDHNGQLFCNPSDDVPVNVIPANGCGSPLEIDKEFLAVVEHVAAWELDPQDVTFEETIFNLTNEEWDDFHISFFADSEFVVSDFEVMGVDHTIEMASGDFFFDFWIFFDEPLLPGEQFFIEGEVTGEAGQITVTQTPSIPEPGSLALFASGLAVLAFIGWRRRKAA